MKSNRNKTIDISLENGQEYLKKCACPPGPLELNNCKNKILNGDFFVLAPKFQPKLFDLVIADPPYNLSKNYGGEIFRKKSREEYAEFTRAWLKESKRLMKDEASLYVCCDWESSLIIGNILSEFFTVRNRITWQREKGRGALKNWKNSMEDIWFCTMSENYQFNLNEVKVKKRVIAPYTENGKPKDWTDTETGKFRLTCPSNFWDDITVPFWSMSENTAHPTQKPEKLLAKLILASSSQGDYVFDPFGGAGSSAVTAKKLDRNFVCIEKNPLYCVWGQMRLEKADADKSIQGFKNGIFLQRGED